MVPAGVGVGLGKTAEAEATGKGDEPLEFWEDWQLTLQKIIRVAVENKRAAVRF